MPHCCIVVQCKSRSNKDRLSFFSIPTVLHHKFQTHLNKLSEERRERWIAAINRKDLTDNMLKNMKVCSRHFISGKPARLDDVNHLDWVPSQYMNPKALAIRKRKGDIERKERFKRRRKIDKEDIRTSQTNGLRRVYEELFQRLIKLKKMGNKKSAEEQ